MVYDWFTVFQKAINDYHVHDRVDAAEQNPYEDGSLQQLLYTKCYIDTVQWHLEDLVRDPAINPDEGMRIKRAIDASNQRRTDLVEKLDDYFIEYLNVPEQHPDGVPLNTESLAWAIDRLSILALKLYHMEVEVNRQHMEEKMDFLKRKLEVLRTQQQDMFLAIRQLVDDVRAGKRYYKVYRQVKMYNDPSLNPVLYKKNPS